MKFTNTLFAAGAFIVSVSSMPVRRDVDPNLIPQFGLAAGINPDGTGKWNFTSSTKYHELILICLQEIVMELTAQTANPS